jgi:hypothetical protein
MSGFLLCNCSYHFKLNTLNGQITNLTSSLYLEVKLTTKNETEPTSDRDSKQREKMLFIYLYY